MDGWKYQSHGWVEISVAWVSEESAGGLCHPMDFEICHFPVKLLAKTFLLASSGYNEISPLLTPLWKNPLATPKNPLLAPLKKMLPTPMSISIS